MTKRFTLDETFMITDNDCMEIISPLMNSKDVAKVYELLNELHEEKEQLQSRINDYDVALKGLQDLCERKLKENEQLKSFNQDLSENLSVCADKRLAQGEHLIKLTNENEQLKQRINVLDDQITAQRIVIESYQNRNQKLFDEKEHIKQTIKEMINTERTEIGKMTLRHLWRQIQ